MSFANQLKTARGNLTQDAAANIISIAKRTYCDWEAGKVVPHRYMQDGSLRDLRATKNVKEHAPPLAGASVETGGEG